MNWLTIGIAAYFTTGILTCYTAAWIFVRYRSSLQFPYSASGAALLLTCAFWILSEAIEILTHGNPGKLVWDLLGYTGVYLIGPAWLFFIIRFTGQDKLLAGKRWLYFCIVPAISLLLLISNPFSEIIWTMKDEAAYLVPFSKSRKLAYYFLNGAMILQFLLGAYWLIRMLGRTRSFYRRQIIILAFLMLIPLSISMYELVTKQKLFFPLSANPFLCCLTAVLIAWLLLSMRWGDILSASRGFILGKMSDAVLVVDNGNFLVDANETALRVMNRELKEVRKQGLESVWPLLHSALQELQSDPGSSADLPLEINGVKKEFNVALTPLTDWMNRVVSKIIVLRDISERRQLEEKLKIHAYELAASNEELQHFAYAATHDLQEPARMVSSYLNLLDKRNEGKLDKESMEFMTFAANGARRMTQLLNDLLEYSKVGTNIPSMDPVDCDDVITGVLQNLKLQIDESGAVVIRDQMPTVRGSKEQLLQLFQNLINNAIKFRGGDPPEIHIDAEKIEGKWLFKVKDNGIGINSAYQEKVFQIFQRLHTNDEYSGTGVGLAICRKVVSRHGGKIWVESEPGHGTTVFFTIGHIEKYS